MARNPTSPRAPRVPGVHDLREAAQSAELGLLPEGTRKTLDEVRWEIQRLLNADDDAKRALRRAGGPLDAAGIRALRDPVHNPEIRAFLADHLSGAVPASSPGWKLDLTELTYRGPREPWTRHDLLCRRGKDGHVLVRIAVRRAPDATLEIRQEQVFEFAGKPLRVVNRERSSPATLLGTDTVVELDDRGIFSFKRTDPFGDGWAVGFTSGRASFVRLNGRFSKELDGRRAGALAPVARFADRAVLYGECALLVAQESRDGVDVWETPTNTEGPLHGLTWADEGGGKPFFAAVRPDGGWDVLDWGRKILRPATAEETARIPQAPVLGDLGAAPGAAKEQFALAPTDHMGQFAGTPWHEWALQVPVVVDWGTRHGMGKGEEFLKRLGSAIGTGTAPFGTQHRAPVVGTSKSVIYVHAAAVDAVIAKLHAGKVRGKSIAAHQVQPGESPFETRVWIPLPGWKGKPEATLRKAVAKWLKIPDPSLVKSVAATDSKIVADVPATAKKEWRWEMLAINSCSGPGPSWDPKRKHKVDVDY